MTVPAIELQDLAHAYADGTPALCGISLRIEPGEAVALVGANGAGKSTLLMHLNGLLLPASGSVRVHGVAVTRANRVPLRRLVGYVFQDADDQLFMPTVWDDVAFGPLNQGLGADEVQTRVADALAGVGATHLAARAPYHLSGGEKRAVALAGVLAMAPAVLVLDEPTAGLDARGRRQLIGILRGVDQTRLIATHDLEFVDEVCQRVLVLEQGRLLADAAPAAVFGDAALMRRCHLEPPRGAVYASHLGQFSDADPSVPREIRTD